MVIKRSYILVLALVSYVVLVFPTLNKPFIGHHDWIGVWESNIARNLIRYSPLDTKFGQVINAGPTVPKGFAFHTHYPPLLPIFLASSFILMGESEATARTLGVVFTLFSATMIYKIGIKYFKPEIGTLAAIIFLAFPITIYFGRMPEHEILVMGPVLLSLYLYLNFFLHPKKSNYIKLILVLVFAHLIHWPGYYITPLLFIHYLIFAKKQDLKIAFSFPLLSLVMFSIHMIYVATLTGSFFGGGLIDVLLFRLNLSQKPSTFTIPNFLNQQAHLIFVYFTRVTVLLSALAILPILKQIRRRSLTLSSQILIILAVFGITHNAVFTNMAFIHDYMIIYMAPFFALASSTAFFYIVKFFNFPKIITITLTVILISLVFFERRTYVQTLFSSNSFYPGYLIGTYIRENTNPPEATLILSNDFGSYFDVFVSYYADRNVFYRSKDLQQLKADIGENRYKMYIAIPSRDTTYDSMVELQKHFRETLVDNYYIYTPK